MIHTHGRIRRFCVFALAWIFTSAIPGEGSELRLRKALVVQQSDRALAVTLGEFDHVKDRVNPLADDCDLHAPIRASDIKVAVVGEFMNACSTGIKPSDVKKLTERSPAEIKGVFRIWFEHPGGKDEILTEEGPLAPYTTSNPAHAVEIHPIVRVADADFSTAIGPIEQDGSRYKAKGPQQLTSLLNRRVTIQEFDGEDGELYVSIESGCCLPNYFRLEATLASSPKKTADGYWGSINITLGASPIPQGLRLFSIEGTAANVAFKGLKKNSKFTFWGITRMDGKKILHAAEENAGESTPIPVEFVLLAIEK